MKQNKYLIYVLLFVALIVSSSCLRDTESEVLLQVENQSGKSFSLTRKDLTKLRRAAVDVTDKSGVTSRYEGVELIDVLQLADAPSGDKLRGESVSDFLVVEGADGYRASFTLAELDPDFSNLKVVLADKRDGQMLSEDEGKLRLVVPAETKRQARWVRQVVKLEIKTVE
jgi:hypothetical protein